MGRALDPQGRSLNRHPSAAAHLQSREHPPRRGSELGEALIRMPSPYRPGHRLLWHHPYFIHPPLLLHHRRYWAWLGLTLWINTVLSLHRTYLTWTIRTEGMAWRMMQMIVYPPTISSQHCQHSTTLPPIIATTSGVRVHLSLPLDHCQMRQIGASLTHRHQCPTTTVTTTAAAAIRLHLM